MIAYFININNLFPSIIGTLQKGEVVNKVLIKNKGYYIIKNIDDYLLISEDYVYWDLDKGLEALKICVGVELKEDKNGKK